MCPRLHCALTHLNNYSYLAIIYIEIQPTQPTYNILLPGQKKCLGVLLERLLQAQFLEQYGALAHEASWAADKRQYPFLPSGPSCRQALAEQIAVHSPLVDS